MALLLEPALHLQHSNGINGIQVIGIDGNDADQPFVPYSELYDYWDPASISEVLKHTSNPAFVETIREKYLRVFSTLVLIDKVDYLTWFTAYNLKDDAGPWIEPYPRWPLDAVAFFKAYESTQWMFFPFEFRPDELIDRHLHSSCILPIEYQEHIVPSAVDVDETRIFKIAIHGLCHDLGDPRRPTNTFLLKTYALNLPDQVRAYRREKEVYSLIESSGPSDHIVRFYGSFQQSGRGYLVLEFVDGGTLNQYLNEVLIPQTASDVHDFWSSVNGLTDGLRKIHQINEASSSSLSLQRGIVHQDLTFDNILIVRSPASAYKFQVKLVDFGRSAVATPAPGGGELRAQDYRGTMTNSSPESTRHDQILEHGPGFVTPAHDTYGLGCIFIELGAWLAGGMDNVRTFRAMRHDELRTYSSFDGSGFTFAFHNGSETLESVAVGCQLFQSQLDHVDDITPEILRIVVKHMLAKEPYQRLSAKQSWCDINNVLNKLGPRSRPDAKNIPSSSTLQLSGLDVMNIPPASRSAPSLTIDQCVQFREDARAGRPTDLQVRTVINRLKSSLGSRDHIFLVDDTPSMEQYHDEVVHAFTGLSAVARELDPNGIELAFLSAPKMIHKRSMFSHTSAMIDKVRTHEYIHDAAMTEINLEEFLDKAVLPKLPHWSRHIRKKNPLTVFVCTDGNWGEGHNDAAGIENPVRKLMKLIEKRGLARTNVALQFLRFGNDEDGKRYLKYLDDEMGQKAKM